TQAWATTKGAGVTVAVIDTGVSTSVPELAGAVVGGTDVSGLGSSNGQTPVGDGSEHGTLVASLMAGRGSADGTGVIGVAPEASILAV
ncbi:S8 family serine peptidase, partial [Cryobacterium sp. 10I1]